MGKKVKDQVKKLSLLGENDLFNMKDMIQDENGEYILETPQEARQRNISRWVINITMFIQSMGFSIVLTGVWPYLQRLEDNPKKTWLGWIVAANPLGQLLFAPLVGYWCNRILSVRIPTIFCLIVFIGANAWYGLLPLHTSGATYFFMIARFFVGVSSAAIASCKTYITQGTTIGERTKAIAHLSLFQALGFILGPAVQVALTPLGKDGIWPIGHWTFSMYTSAGWVACLFGVINVILYHPMIFKESNIAAKEAFINSRKGGKKVDWSAIKPDWSGLIPVIIAFSIVILNFVLLETLATPVSMDQFAWDEELAIRNVGLTTIVSSIITLGCFWTISPLAIRFGERQVLLILGFIPMMVGRIFFLPIFGGDKPQMLETICENKTDPFEIDWPSGQHYIDWLSNATKKDVCDDIDGLEWRITQHGCPKDQEWCYELDKLNPWIVAVGYLFATIGYPYCMAILQAIFSKMVGPRPQGMWMGFLTAISSVSRAAGPVFVGYIYTGYGTLLTFLIIIGATLFAFIILLVFYKKIIPLQIPVVPDDDNEPVKPEQPEQPEIDDPLYFTKPVLGDDTKL